MLHWYFSPSPTLQLEAATIDENVVRESLLLNAIENSSSRGLVADLVPGLEVETTDPTPSRGQAVPNLLEVEDDFLQDCLRARVDGRRSLPRCTEAIRALGAGR
ncbi:MAG: hypothetical protein AAF614_11615 [Chloroflexota bacterium]